MHATIVSTVSTIVLVVLGPALAAADWQDRAPLLRPRGEHANCVVDGRIYVLGGIHNSRNGPIEVDRYDPSSDAWTRVSSMPTRRNHFTCGAALAGDELWVCGGKPDGQGYGGVKRVDVYDTRTGSWRRAPDLPEPHWAGPTVIIDGKVHVLTGGGASNSDSTAHHFVLDLADESAGWSTARAVPKPRVHVAGVAYRGRIWIIGGEYHHRHDGDTTTVQVYDPATDSWTQSVAQLPQARSHHEWATFVHDDRIWTVSGVDSSQSPRAQETIYRYDPGADRWDRLDDLPHKLASPGAKIVNGTLHVFGGGIDNWFGGDLKGHWAWTLDGTTPPPDTTPPAAPTGLTVSVE